MAMSLQEMPGLAVLFVVAIVVVGFGAVITSGIGDGLTGEASQVVGNGTAGLLKFGTFFPTIALVIIGALVIGILVRSFM